MTRNLRPMPDAGRGGGRPADPAPRASHRSPPCPRADAPLAATATRGVRRRPATAAAPAGRSSRACGCARPFAPVATRRPRRGARRTCSARSRPGTIDPKLWGSEELKANADLCIHCTLCRSECPSGVDVSSLMIEAKAAYVAEPRPDAGRLDGLADRAVGEAGEPVPDPLERPDGQPRRAVADRAALRPLAASPAAASPPHAVRPPGRAARPDRAQAAGSRGRGSPISSTSSPTTSTRSWPRPSSASSATRGSTSTCPKRQRGSGMAALVDRRPRQRARAGDSPTSACSATPCATATRSSAPSRRPR